MSYKINNKPVVLYDPSFPPHLTIGSSTILQPINHSGPLVSNNTLARTSHVTAIHSYGEFETENTYYKPGIPNA